MDRLVSKAYINNMWGTSFSDLARKAQELQDQAAEAATHAAEAASSLSVRFNGFVPVNFPTTKKTHPPFLVV